MDLFLESQAQEIKGRPRRTIQIDGKTELLRQKYFFVWWGQLSVVYYELLKPGETVNIKLYLQ